MTNLRELHWLRVSERIDFKIAVLVWKCIHCRAAAYLSDLCRPLAGIPGRRQLRSSSSSDLLVPRSRTATGQRAFAIRTSALEPPSSVSAVAGAITVHVSAKPKDISDGRKITAVASQRLCDIA